MTSTGISWVLVAATGAKSTVLDHDHVDIASDDGDITGQQGAVRGALAIADASGYAVRSVSLRYTDDVEANASLLRKWLRDTGLDNIDTPPVAKPARRRRRFGSPLRAAAIVVGGVIALFAVAPELGGGPEASSADSDTAPITTVVAVTVAPLNAPASSLKTYTIPDVAPATRPAPTYTSAPEAVVAAPDPVAPVQDPMAEVLSSVVSALP
ncbi:hypothetical protein ABQE93_20295 [Mycolicibacterium sp. XJ662]